MTAGPEASSDAVTWRELVVLSTLGAVLPLQQTLRQGGFMAALFVLEVPALPVAGVGVARLFGVGSSASWWGAFVGLALLVVPLWLAPFVVFALARTDRRHDRVLLVERCPAGRALVAARRKVDEDGRPFWRATNLVSVPARGVPAPADRLQRPGARLTRRAVERAREAGVGIRLNAANSDVASKVYEPAGFVHDEPGTRRAPRSWLGHVAMHLPDLPTSPRDEVR